MNPIKKNIDRYLEIRDQKAIKANQESVLKLLDTDAAGLNNYFMAGLGVCTLMLRLGALIQMCRKFEALDDAGDALFLKQIIDNLRETLPSDTNWKNLWVISAHEDKWQEPALQPKGGQSLLDQFVTFRNRFVHQIIKLTPEQAAELAKGIQIIEHFVTYAFLFDDGELTVNDNEYFWVTNSDKIRLHPYMQQLSDLNMPYIFQGLYANKTEAHLLNLTLGDETYQAAEQFLEPTFNPIREALKGGAGQVFDHSDRLAYYQSCFVGRERERQAVLEFCKSKEDKNRLCIKSPAGMGKGALVADVISKLQDEKIQVLYHFCGSGMQNSLHASLYHLILQGNRMQYWDRSDEVVARKLTRLPTKYVDAIQFFHNLIDTQLRIQKNNTSENLVIIIDGLDEAFVAYSQLFISDWFYNYNEKEEPESDWNSTPNVRWIFTYRCDESGAETFYRFPQSKANAEIKILQPLKGLSADAVDEAFKDLPVSNEFKETVIEKGAILT